MKYRIWQVKDIDYLSASLDLINIEKIDRSNNMFISPSGKFMTWSSDDDPELGNCYIMEQDPIYFELEILE